MNLVFSKFETLTIVLLLLASCTSTNTEENEFKHKALVLYSGEVEGFLMRSQDSYLAYRDKSGIVQITTVELPGYSRPVTAGDSLTIEVNDDEVNVVGLLGSNDNYSIRNIHSYRVYLENFKNILHFDNGVLYSAIVDIRSDSIQSLDFFCYSLPYPENDLVVSPVGFPTDTAFIVGGGVGNDSIFIEDLNYSFYRIKD